MACILGAAAERVRIVPTACGGGFGGKLDLSLQPYVALAAWLRGTARALRVQPTGIDGDHHEETPSADARPHRRVCRWPDCGDAFRG